MRLVLTAAMAHAWLSAGQHISCNSSQSLQAGSFANTALATDPLTKVRPQLEQVCDLVVSGTSTERSDWLSFSVTRGDGELSGSNCRFIFERIISQCILTEMTVGGKANVGNTVYEVLRLDRLERRAKKPATAPKNPPPVAKPSKTSKQAPPARPTTPNAPPPAAKPSSLSCKIKDPTKDIDDGVSRRDLNTYNQRSPRAILLPRAPKDGNPCSDSGYGVFKLRADDYPSNNKKNIEAYGFEQQNDYCDYKWQSGSKKILDGAHKYHSEHVMEWQIVTDFFRKLNKAGGVKGFEHPDPSQLDTSGKRKKVDFCTYWIESWDGRTVTDQDSSKKFKLSLSGNDPLTAWQHIAAAYPSRIRNKKEMVALQGNINTPAKANLFQESSLYVFSDAVMKPIKAKRNKVVENLRLLHGVQLYMTDKHIVNIFKQQKKRMSDILEALDSEMSKQVREAKDDKGVVRTYTPWVKQDLKKKWDAYMNIKWDTAVKKHDTAFERFHSAAHRRWCPKPPPSTDKEGVEYCQRLKKVNDNHIAAASTHPFRRPW